MKKAIVVLLATFAVLWVVHVFCPSSSHVAFNVGGFGFTWLACVFAITFLVIHHIVHVK